MGLSWVASTIDKYIAFHRGGATSLLWTGSVSALVFQVLGLLGGITDIAPRSEREQTPFSVFGNN